MQLIRKIIIPEILRNVQISNSRRAKYYDLTTIRPEDVAKLKLPKKYLDAKYEFILHKLTSKSVWRLVNKETGVYVIKNPIAVGTPKLIKVNFQKIWNNEVSDHTRNKIATELKNSYSEVLDEVEPIKDGFPLKTQFTFHTKDELQDIDNLSILYIKTFHDALTQKGIIPEDNLRYLKRYEAIHEESEDEYIEVAIYSL